MMKRKFAAQAAAAGLAAIVLPSLAAGQAPPPMGGGYTNVIPIPVDDPKTKSISGALFKPEGAGPFPTVVAMPWCGGVDIPLARAFQKTLIDHLLSKGFATLIVDPFTPRGQLHGCSGGDIGIKDALAAVKVVRAMPDIDVTHIFVQGYSRGATASLALVNTANPDSGDTKVAGVIAYYPYCGMVSEPSVPVLVLIGDKDQAAPCLALKGTPNFEVVVYPGATHGFNAPGVGDIEGLGHDMVYDEKAAQDAGRRADAFMAAHMPPK